MTDLFPEAKADSPKLAWLKKHRLETYHYGGGDGWRCSNSGRTNEALGFTEEEAILAYCEKYGLKHYSLE